MTVCIAVLPEGGDKIVLVSDQLLSSDETSVDGVMKWATITPGVEWYVMFAGDARRFSPLMDRVRALLGDTRNKRLTVATVQAAFERACAAEMTARVEAEVLRPYGLTHADFVRKGKRLLGEIRFNHVADQVVATDLGIDVMVAGLDAWARTQLLTVTPQGVVSKSVLPYHAIGSGAFVALGALYSVPYFPAFGSELAETVYRTCAAKFAAEAAPGVGKATHAMIVSPVAGTWTLLMDVDQLRSLWKSRGQPPVPGRALQLIRSDLKRLAPRPYRRSVRGARRR